MFENLDIFRMAHAMAQHAGARQAVIAQNMANADTPGYAARDIAPFHAVLETNERGFAPRATRSAHLSAVGQAFVPDVSNRPEAETTPNGNSISVEAEMMHAVEVRRQHNQALAIYKFSIGILRAATASR